MGWNTLWLQHVDNSLQVVRARLDIEEGDEICISYLSEAGRIFGDYIDIYIYIGVSDCEITAG